MTNAAKLISWALRRDMSQDMADTLTQDALAALAAAGFKIVPKNATDAMVQAGSMAIMHKRMDRFIGGNTVRTTSAPLFEDDARIVWREMMEKAK